MNDRPTAKQNTVWDSKHVSPRDARRIARSYVYEARVRADHWYGPVGATKGFTHVCPTDADYRSARRH